MTGASRLTRRALGGLVLAVPALAQGTASPYAAGQAVRLVLPFPPGNSADIVARKLADLMRQRWGVAVVVDNRPGASGAIALGFVAKAPADGVTLLVSSLSPLVVSPAVARSLPYDVQRDFAPVAPLAFNDVMLLASPQLPATSIPALLALKGRELPYASIGPGTLSHLTLALFAARAGLRVQHVPYTGSAQAYTDLLRGDVALMVDALPQALPQVQGGRLRGLAIFAPRRSPFAPDVPAITETPLAGDNDIRVIGWVGMAAPGGTPAGFVARLNAAVQALMAEPEMQDFLRAQSLQGYPPTTPEGFATYMAGELAQWRGVARAAGVEGTLE